MNKYKLDALFIGAHPDDIEITSAGTLIKLVRAGKKTGIIDLTRGELSTRGDLIARKKETDSASKILGISFRKNLDLPDGNIENNRSNRLKLIQILRKYEPEIVFAPYPSDRHPDHINAGNLIREACFFSGLHKIKTKDQKPHRPKRIFYFRHSFDIPISFIMDISDTFNLKMKSILAYKTQFYRDAKITNEPETFISNKLFIKDIETRARFYGFKIGVEFGEPFYCENYLNVSVKEIFNI